MNEQTLKLIEQLAQKLGTTSEYLWEVLIKQAEVQAWISASSILAFCLFAFGAYKWTKWVYLNYENLYDKDLEVPYTFGSIMLAACILGWFVASIFDVHTIITVLNNPEYWALKQVLDVIQ